LKYTGATESSSIMDLGHRLAFNSFSQAKILKPWVYCLSKPTRRIRLAIHCSSLQTFI